MPELHDALPRPFVADEDAAAHHQLFAFNVFPFESIFLDASGLLGGDVTRRVQMAYRMSGLTVDTAGTEADHVGLELAALAQLCAHAAGAEPVQTHQQLSRQRRFLEAHLLRWLPALRLAVAQQGDGFYTAVSSLTLSLAADHYRDLLAQDAAEQEDFALPEAPDLLQSDKTSLKDIATFLVTPPYGGTYFSRDDVSRVARGLQLPRGFGSRQQMLHNLMRTAVQYDKLPALFDSLQEHLLRWQHSYADIVRQQPVLASFVLPWQARVTVTQQLLTHMQTMAETMT